jgi:hypothetical protein
MSYPSAYPHDPIEAIGDDLFMARGSIRMNAMGRISRNMAIVRHRGELTLVNPIRLDDAGETQLKALGDVTRIMRLGSMHGLDDPYYVNELGAELWAQAGGTTYPNPDIDCELSAGMELPFPDARLFCFETTTQPESALLISRDGGTLLTCDGIQHYGDYSNNSLIPRLLMPFIGFPRTTLVGPIWLKMLTPEGASLRGDFERLLGLDFDALLSAHGSLLRSGAHQAVEQAVARAFDS